MPYKILLLDDVPTNRAEVLQALTQAIGNKGRVEEFAPGVGGETEGIYEQRLIKDFSAAPNQNADLIVADRDLSGYRDNYPGLSEATVRLVADSVGIPECGYARGEREGDLEYVGRGEQREACIRLSLKPLDRFAQQIVGIVEGFSEIRERIPEAIKTSTRSPGSIMASILGKPEYGDKISAYASGDQNRLDMLARLRNSKNKTESAQRLTCLLGYWLWDSVLRFPGVVVHTVAASSYLNIREDIFVQDEKLQGLFDAARYRGPFAGTRDRAWWRGMLDDIVAESGFKDGREYASRKSGKDIPASQCYVDPSRTAGYYCMLARKPVSLANSKGGLPWFPRGADIARVGTPKLDELGPWL